MSAVPSRSQSGPGRTDGTPTLGTRGKKRLLPVIDGLESISHGGELSANFVNQDQPEQSYLLRRPGWGVALLLYLFCVGILFFYTRASWRSPVQMLIVAGGALAFPAFFALSRFLLRQAFQRLVPSIFAAGCTIVVVLVLLFVPTGIEQALAFSPVLGRTVSFCVIASVGAFGAALAQRRNDKKRRA